MNIFLDWSVCVSDMNGSLLDNGMKCYHDLWIFFSDIASDETEIISDIACVHQGLDDEVLSLWQIPVVRKINPWCAKFFTENIKMCLLLISFLHIDMTQIVEILPQVRQELAYST